MFILSFPTGDFKDNNFKTEKKKREKKILQDGT